MGWLTGRDSDLICVKPNITNIQEGNLSLSPVCLTPCRAALGFLLKRLLLIVDLNLDVS